MTLVTNKTTKINIVKYLLLKKMYSLSLSCPLTNEIMIWIIFMIPALVFHGIFVASQSLHLKNIWQQKKPCSSSFCIVFLL